MRPIIIRQIFRRSPLLILLFAAIGALLIMCFSVIAKLYYEQSLSWPDFLSGEHIDVYVYQYLPDTENPITVEDLIDYCKEREDSFIIYRNFEFSGGREVYLSGDTPFKPEIVEGRSFTEEDFEKKIPVAIIADEKRVVNKCVIIDDRNYFLHENIEYEVIGKFKRPSRTYLQEEPVMAGSWVYDSSYFVNMAASFETGSSSSINGDYTIDAKEKSIEFLNDFKAFAGKINPDIGFNLEETEVNIPANNVQRLMRAINYEDSIMAMTVCFIISFLILLSAPAITKYWVEGRKEEISARKLSGGKPSTIRNMMLRDYLIIATAGYLLGLLVIIVLVYLKLLSYMGVTVYPAAVISGYIICLLIGLIFGFISLTIISEKNTTGKTGE